MAVLGLLLGRNPLLTLGLVSPQFVAYEGASADQVRFVLDDGWSKTAAVPGALLMDWSDGQSRPAQVAAQPVGRDQPFRMGIGAQRRAGICW